MLKIFSKIILKLIRWHVDVSLPVEKKFVLIGAPHTSNWDLALALLCFWSLEIPMSWVGKKQLFIGPLGYILRLMGGIPVDRSVRTGFIEQIAQQFDNREKMILSLAPEGTRSKTDYWKTGFYYIALTAKVPICLAYADYPKRTVGFGKMITPSGDIDKDFELIRAFYLKKEGKYPENQGPIKIRER